MSGSRITLLASPDEYLLELERQDAVAAWIAAHPDGEAVTLDPAPEPLQLIRELVNRSLFSPTRLFVVPDSLPYFKTRGDEATWGDAIAGALGPLSLADTDLLLAAALDREPKGALADLVRARGELQFLSLPAAPKPWEDLVVTPAQRAVLHRVIARVALQVAARSEVVDALCEAYGFKVRELAQAAERLALSGDVTAEAVRAQAGVGECSLQRLENALIDRDRAAVAQLLGRLAAGGVLVDWWGEAVDAGGVGPVLTGMLGRTARLALAMRCHARRCTLEKELDPARCAAQYWYGGTYKKRLHDTLASDAAEAGDSPIAGMSPWAAHRAFRVAAAYEESELIDLLNALARCSVERSPAREAVPALAPLLLALTAPRAAEKRSRKR
jgi:hypothetical protein